MIYNCIELLVLILMMPFLILIITTTTTNKASILYSAFLNTQVTQRHFTFNPLFIHRHNGGNLHP